MTKGSPLVAEVKYSPRLRRPTPPRMGTSRASAWAPYSAACRRSASRSTSLREARREALTLGALIYEGRPAPSPYRHVDPEADHAISPGLRARAQGAEAAREDHRGFSVPRGRLVRVFVTLAIVAVLVYDRSASSVSFR